MLDDRSTLINSNLLCFNFKNKNLKE